MQYSVPQLDLLSLEVHRVPFEFLPDDLTDIYPRTVSRVDDCNLHAFTPRPRNTRLLAWLLACSLALTSVSGKARTSKQPFTKKKAPYEKVTRASRAFRNHKLPCFPYVSCQVLAEVVPVRGNWQCEE